MKRKNAILLAFAIAILAGTAYQLFKRTSLDFSQDEEPFRSMAMPPKEVIGNYYMDGGSVSLRVVDAKGSIHDVTFPINYYNLYDSHPTAFSGTFSDSKTISLKDPARAKAIAIQLFKDYRYPVNDPEMEPFDANDAARRRLTYPPANVVDRVERKATKFLSEL